MRIVPRTGRGVIINNDALKFQSLIIDLPFINLKIAVSFFRFIVLQPLFSFELILDFVKQSNSILDFLKALVIFPKSIYLVEIFKKEDVSHIHSFTTSSPAVMAFVMSKLLKVPWSYTLHTSAVLRNNCRRSITFQSSSASLCRTISNLTANDLLRFIGNSNIQKIKCVHLGVPFPLEVNRKKRDAAPFVIVTPAALLPYKGHIYAIDAAKILISLGVNEFKWFFYGSGPLYKELNVMINQLGLGGNCFLCGNIDHSLLINKYSLNEVDLVVLTSTSNGEVPEGIPVSLMEAMSYGIPVIATNSGATLELIGGGSGVSTPQCDSVKLAHEIKEFLNNYEYCISQGALGREKVGAHFNTLKNAKELLDFF